MESEDIDDDFTKYSFLYDTSIYHTEMLSTTPFYDGSKVSLMEALVKNLLWFSEHPGISKEALSDLLGMQHADTLPLGNKMPSSYGDAIKLIEPFLIQPITFHVCPNDCIVYRKQYFNHKECPKCGSSRYISKKIPAKRFIHLPVGPRLVRLFGTCELSKIVQDHGFCVSGHGSNVYDIHASTVWKSAYSNNGYFASDFRGISFALNTDIGVASTLQLGGGHTL